MRLRRITLAMVMHSWRPHSRWPRERLKAAFGGRRSLTSLEVLGLDVPAQDRLWAVLREEIVPARELRLIACWCADRALSRERAAGCEPDTRSWWAAAVARRFANGRATEAQLAAAGAAASAVISTTVSAVWANAAAAATTWDNAADAARAAARDTTLTTTLTVDIEQIIKHVRRVLRRLENA